MVGKQLIENVIKQIGTKVKTDYVHKVTGKGLSTEDYTTTEKTKLSNIEANAEVNIIEDVKVNGTSMQVTNKAVDIEVPTKVSDITNDSGFIDNTVNNLVNYYKKTETYTQEEIDQMISTIPKFRIQVVQELPVEDISNTTIYLVVTGDESQNLYTEYIYVNNTWEKLGTQKLDVSNFVTMTDYATGSKAGIIKASSYYNFGVEGSGLPFTNTKTMTQYNSMNNNAFIGKGTLENVIAGKQLINKTQLDESQASQDEAITALQEENELLRKDIAGLPTNTATGESIDITDSAEMRFEKLDAGGNSKQKTTEGRNLLAHMTGNTSKGITTTYDNVNGALILNGTATATYSDLTNLTELNLEPGDYVVSLKDEKPYNTVLKLKFQDDTSQEITIPQNSKFYAFSVSQKVIAQRVFVYQNTTFQGTTFTNEKLYIQLEPGSSVTDFEPSTGRTSKSKSRIRTAST